MLARYVSVVGGATLPFLLYADIEFEVKDSKLVLKDFNATLDLLAYSGQSAGGTVRFDAKPARGNFMDIPPDKPRNMYRQRFVDKSDQRLSTYQHKMCLGSPDGQDGKFRSLMNCIIVFFTFQCLYLRLRQNQIFFCCFFLKGK